MIPSVGITKSDGNTGVVKPSVDGVLAIIAPCQSGTQNQPSSFARQDLALTAFGYGKLTDDAAYVMSVAQKPVVLIRASASTAGAYGAVTINGAGTATPVAGASVPLDDFNVLITFGVGGALGTAGITYTYSLDGGVTTSGVQALGTSLILTIPNTGVSFTLGTSTQTILAGETIACPITGPRMNNTDLGTALEALRTYAGAWEAILVDGLDATSTTISTLDTWLSTREGEGKYRTAIVNSVPRDPSTQTEAQYATAMTTAFSTSSSIRVVVCADAGDLVSLIRGVVQKRPISVGVAARGMLNDIARDCAFVLDGPITGYEITDSRDNPKYHDEALYPGLDDLRLTTLRSFDAREGAYVNNALLLSPSGSDYVYWQHARVMNKACEIAFQLLTNRLSQGVRKDVTTGFILPEDADEIEHLVNDELDKQLVRVGRVSGAKFVLARTDDLSSNQGATLSGEVQVSALAYVKKFAVNARFVKKITVGATQ